MISPAPHDPGGVPALPEGHESGDVDRGAGAPVRALFVLHDPGCPLCRSLVAWLRRQRTLVPLGFLPAGSAEARRAFPDLDHSGTLREITVIGDGGQVYVGAGAWITVLWALAGYRGLSYRLATPVGMPLARAAVLAAARIRAAAAGGPGECDETCDPAG